MLALALGSYLSYRWVANYRAWLAACLDAILSYALVTRVRTRYDRLRNGTGA